MKQKLPALRKKKNNPTLFTTFHTSPNVAERAEFVSVWQYAVAADLQKITK